MVRLWAMGAFGRLGEAQSGRREHLPRSSRAGHRLWFGIFAPEKRGNLKAPLSARGARRPVLMRRERFSARPPRGLDQDGAPGRAVSLAHNPLYGPLTASAPTRRGS